RIPGASARNFSPRFLSWSASGISTEKGTSLMRFQIAASSPRICGLWFALSVAPGEGAKVAAPEGATAPVVDGIEWSPSADPHTGGQLVREKEIIADSPRSLTPPPLSLGRNEDFS